jgi:thiosulfate/3-mercaptopyruvate sulfurtransferase
MFRTLISPADLNAQRDDPAWVIVDCRFELTDPTAGARWFAESHIPRAVFADLERDLSAPVTPATGRHPLPEPEQLARTFARCGIDEHVQVIAYDQDAGAYAARLWWLLHWLGHEKVAVLDGGYAAWLEAGFDTSNEPHTPAPRAFVARPRRDMLITADEVTQYTCPDTRLLDARAPERYAGVVEPLDRIAGHVPGARNHPFASNLTRTKSFDTPDSLRSRYEASLGNIAPDHTAVMCGSGVTACHLLLAMEHAGMPGAKLYAGSWSEWIRDPTRPIRTGAEP